MCGEDNHRNRPQSQQEALWQHFPAVESHPADAYLIKMHMEGLSYQQMAKKMLGNKPKSDGELKKKTDSINEQFTRNTSGSMADFKSCLERVMRKNQLIHDDMLN
jgi:hypothetical protein